MTGAFNCTSQFALVLGACTSLPARADFAFVGDETAQDIRLFIVNRHVFVGAKLADFRAGVIATLLPTFHFILHGVIHRM